jgi:hypothetical protein
MLLLILIFSPPPFFFLSFFLLKLQYLARFMSHFSAAQVFSSKNKGAFRNIGELQIPKPGQACLFHDCDFSSFLHWLDEKRYGLNGHSIKPISLSLPWTLGDFMLRYFVGFDACQPGECLEDDLTKAKHRLATLFEVVLILESVNDVGWKLMNNKYGWPGDDSQVKRAGTHIGSDARVTLKNDPDALAALRKFVGQNDIDLYDYAVNLSQQQVKATTS